MPAQGNKVRADRVELIVIAGFLGSGKTTIILSLSRRLVQEQGRRLVIIENEAGEVGLDGEYLQRAGLLVQELYTGCVCCQLMGDLLSTLTKVEEQFEPDVVIVEPSGIANLGSLLSVLCGYRGSLKNVRVLSLIDILRFDTLMKVVSPLIISHVEKANVVAINKIERVPLEQVNQALHRLKGIKGDAEFLPVSAIQGTNIDALFNRLLG